MPYFWFEKSRYPFWDAVPEEYRAPINEAMDMTQLSGREVSVTGCLNKQSGERTVRGCHGDSGGCKLKECAFGEDLEMMYHTHPPFSGARPSNIDVYSSVLSQVGQLLPLNSCISSPPNQTMYCFRFKDNILPYDTITKYDPDFITDARFVGGYPAEKYDFMKDRAQTALYDLKSGKRLTHIDDEKLVNTLFTDEDYTCRDPEWFCANAGKLVPNTDTVAVVEACRRRLAEQCMKA